MDRCDIIIPVWNHLEMTRECLESIKKHTDYPYRLVIIDNASDAPTKNYLESIRGEGDTVVIRNENNLGFVKAVNQGMKHSDSAYLCIMNNDTLAADGWLGEMVDILKAHPEIGMVNPSSNSFSQFSGDLDINTYAKTLKRFKGDYQELYTGRAFAIVVKREVVDKAGYLDEIYGMGYYDDTDFCKRAQRLGYRVVRAKAAYVYHKESQSFSKIREKSEILLNNEREFISRWGRYLRVAYVVPGKVNKDESLKISANAIRIARMGHQVWIFTTPSTAKGLSLVDHDSIRVLVYPGFLLNMTVLYKIWKRKKKKKQNCVITDNMPAFRLFSRFRNMIDAEVFNDEDMDFIDSELKSISSSAGD